MKKAVQFLLSYTDTVSQNCALLVLALILAQSCMFPRPIQKVSATPDILLAIAP